MSTEDKVWAVFLFSLLAAITLICCIGIYYIHDNSIKQIAWRTKVVETCSPPANWNAPICILIAKKES